MRVGVWSPSVGISRPSRQTTAALTRTKLGPVFPGNREELRDETEDE